VELRGRTVVVTGGSQGIGEAMAERFAAAGADVLVVARNREKLSAVADRIGGDYLAADLTNASEVDRLIPACRERLGRIDVLVNNAGIEDSDAFVHLDRDRLRSMARLNFEAAVLLTRDVLPHMLERGEGHLVQMSSITGAMTFPGAVAYSGTKAGLTNMAEGLRMELEGTGVGLTIVAPGPVDTDMWNRVEVNEGYTLPVLRRLQQLRLVPKVSAETVAQDVVRAVQQDRPHVRPGLVYGPFHMLNNVSRRLTRLALTGVDLDPLVVDDPSASPPPAGSDPAGEVEAANAAFYAAHEARDLDAMRQVWGHGDDAVCVHPGWPILRGWEQVEESWRRIFDGPGRNQFILTNESVEVHDRTAWVTVEENLVDRGDTQAIAATNVFIRTTDGWKLVAHHGSPVMMR
jgi:short-subunit dehydrogenase/ketosteroid isomerase-like protein